MPSIVGAVRFYGLDQLGATATRTRRVHLVWQLETLGKLELGRIAN
jgi:hypothetical protein